MNTLIDQKQQLKNFQEVIHPITIEDFCTNYWEKKPLLIRREDSAYYNSLLSIKDVDQVLDYHRPKGGSIRVVKNQEPMNPTRYENADGSLNLNQLYAAYGDGYTLVVNGIQRFWKPVKTLCQNMRLFLSHKVVGNMYLTPENQKALLPHYDTHDVFVIQVSGSKHWKIYDADYETPLLNSFQPIFKREQLKNVKEITLHAGDMMYIPRGIPHEAYTTDDSSLHLTLGIYPIQWIDFITKSLQNMAQTHIELRQALPIGFLDSKRTKADFYKEIEPLLADLLMATFKKENVQGALLHLEEEFRTQEQPKADGHFYDLDMMHKIELDSLLDKRENMYCKVQQIGNAARIIFPGNVIRGPIHIAATLDFIAKSEGAFQVSDIPFFNDSNKLKLAKRLIRGGLFTFRFNTSRLASFLKKSLKTDGFHPLK